MQKLLSKESKPKEVMRLRILNYIMLDITLDKWRKSYKIQ